MNSPTVRSAPWERKQRHYRFKAGMRRCLYPCRTAPPPPRARAIAVRTRVKPRLSAFLHCHGLLRRLTVTFFTLMKICVTPNNMENADSGMFESMMPQNRNISVGMTESDTARSKSFLLKHTIQNAMYMKQSAPHTDKYTVSA